MIYQLTMRLCAVVPGVRTSPVRLEVIVENLPPEANTERKFYGTEQEFEGYLSSAAKAIVESVIPLFDCLTRPLVLSTAEMQTGLSVDTQEKAEAFRLQHSLSWATDSNGVAEMIEKAEEVIKTVQFKPLEEASNLLVSATAYIGELIRRVHGGEWAWNPPHNKVFSLNQIGGHDKRAAALGATMHYWIWPEFFGYHIAIGYKKMVKEIASLEDYIKRQEAANGTDDIL
ncbi:MAG: hypothetical protein FWE96_07240 [Coriobacteriia bacterium]|nr:hypothetical protein [Coriobacteriia bacterium]